METNRIYIRLGQPRGTLPGRRPGLLGKLAAATVGTVLLVGAFMVSVVVLAVVAAVGLVGGAWLWWRTRELRQRVKAQMAAQMQAREQADGRVIEGEVIRKPD
jgi:hypothetical protein